MEFSQKIYQKIESFDNEIAISSYGRKISYKFLNQISMKIVRLFKNNFLDSSVVGIVGQRNFSVYFGILGAIYSGCTYVPINHKYSEDRISKIIKEANVSVLIGNRENIKSIKKSLDSNFIKVILFPDEENVEPNIFPKKIKCFYKSDLIDLSPLEPKKIDSSNIFYILFTSGSTGDPKGVMVTIKNVETFIQNMNAFYKLKVGYKASQTFDLGFDPSIVDMFLTWINGGQLCLLSQEELIMPYDYIKREKINFWYSVPTLVKFMFKMGYLIPNSFPELKYSIFTGEALSKKLCDAWQIAAPNSTIENGYGPTEATVNITKFVYKREFKKRKFTNNIIPIGKIFNGHSFELIDEDFNKVKKGEKGHLIIKGEQIALGYINDHEKTQNSFKKMPWDNSNQKWYLTGDFAIVNDLNEIEYLGRIDNQIKIAGRRIEVGEIEAALLKSNIINDIIIVPQKDSDESVKSLVGFTTSNISNDEKIKINQFALKYIEKIFLPRKIIFIEKLPETSSGKTDRKKLFNIINTNLN